MFSSFLKLFFGGVLFLPPSYAYVRSFLYLLYTLIKLYKKKKKLFFGLMQAYFPQPILLL